jgi:hypothetical protein
VSDHIRLQPISRYRIVHRYGGVTEIRYCDDRSEAITLAAELGGVVECYVLGIGWEPITKVAEASE